MAQQLEAIRRQSFNRTFLVLKGTPRAAMSAFSACFNRTFLVLKEHVRAFCRTRGIGFNRTFLVLKDF